MDSVKVFSILDTIYVANKREKPIQGGLVFTWEVIGSEEDKLFFLHMKEDNSMGK
jgi:hypothetical protein